MDSKEVSKEIATGFVVDKAESVHNNLSSCWLPCTRCEHIVPLNFRCLVFIPRLLHSKAKIGSQRIRDVVNYSTHYFPFDCEILCSELDDLRQLFRGILAFNVFDFVGRKIRGLTSFTTLFGLCHYGGVFLR